MRWPWSRKHRAEFDSGPMPIDHLFLQMLGKVSDAPVSRRDALTVPAVLRGRNMICGSISSMPLEQRDPDNELVRSPLLEQIDPDVANIVTLAQTLEDLLFDSLSWWLITDRGFDGYPMSARHLDLGSVSLQPPGNRRPAPLPSGFDPRGGIVWIDGKPVPGTSVIRFDSPNPPIRVEAARAIRRAILLDRAAAMYADDPRPADYFEPAEHAEDMDDEEIRAFLAKWKSYRQSRTTAYVPSSVRYHSVDAPSPAELQLVELQKQASLDLANAFGIDPEDLGISTTSRTYSNDVDRRRNKVNEVLFPYMRAITDRLSMGDVTKRGYKVKHDTSVYLQPNPTDRWYVYQAARHMNAITVEEIRKKEGEPPLPPGADEEAQMPSNVVTMPVPGRDGMAASRFSFDDGQTNFTLDVPVEQFSVDRDNRIIEGMVLPYGQAGTKGGISFEFDRGALQWDAEHPGKVKLVFPRHGMAVGRAIQLKDTPVGLFARFKVGRGQEGDRALESAEDRVFDGFSVGVDFDARTDAEPDPQDRNRLRVRRADLRHVALTDEPVFDNARVTRVAASRTEGGGQVPDTDTTTGQTPESTQPETPPASAPAGASGNATGVEFSDDTVRDLMRRFQELAEGEGPTVVNASRQPTSTVTAVSEPVPYRFDRAGNFVPNQEHVFSADLHEMALARDNYGTETEAGKRVMGLLRATFDVDSADINELTPNIQRPDMFVDQRDFRTPLWNFINKGAPPNGIQPFTFPKFNTASGLVGDHTEGTEPTSGTYTATNQTVTPTPISGKASITREVWDMGGNPAVSTLVFNQMVRGYREGLESAAATFLNTLTAATDIALTAEATDEALAAEWDAALVDLQFVRGYDFEAFALEKALYKAFAAARDTTGRTLYPQINPQNANGTAARRFTTLDLGGVTGVPSWALPTDADPTVANNSWLFDPSTVHGWSTPPQRLEFPGTDTSGGYAPVAMVDLAIWGYKAFANSDIGGVRQVTYAADDGV